MKKKLSLFLASLFVTGSLAGCGKAADTSKGDTIKVGLNYELSGPVATYGQSQVDGIELAVKEINKNGGRS